MPTQCRSTTRAAPTQHQHNTCSTSPTPIQLNARTRANKKCHCQYQQSEPACGACVAVVALWVAHLGQLGQQKTHPTRASLLRPFARPLPHDVCRLDCLACRGRLSGHEVPMSQTSETMSPIMYLFDRLARGRAAWDQTSTHFGPRDTTFPIIRFGEVLDL